MTNDSALARLLTVWCGELPPWLDLFRERLRASTKFDWELVHFDDVGELNALASRALGYPCRKGSAYAACDYRPAYGELFAQYFDPYRYWGWLDLDVVVGDLDRLVAPELQGGWLDVYSTDWWTVNGALSLFRNCKKVNTLWRELPGDPDCKRLFAEPEYENYDECGFNDKGQQVWGLTNRNPSFTGVVKSSGVTYKFDDRSWNETVDTLPGGVSSRGCELKAWVEGRPGPERLLEIPTGRELVLYHFGERWPLPDAYPGSTAGALRCSAAGYPEPPLVDSQEYWSRRVAWAREHRSGARVLSFDTSEAEWLEVQKAAKEAFRLHVPKLAKVLDVGCGHGGLLEALVSMNWRGEYVGVDFSEDVVGLAREAQARLVERERRSRVTFSRADARDLPFPDRHFDWCLCRGLEGSTKTRVSCEDWRRMLAEMRRVAKRVMVMNLSGGYEVVQ